MATLDGASVDRVVLAIPRYGSWCADVVMTSGELPTGEVVLEVAGLEMHGTVLLGGLDSPDRPHAFIVGAPGWDRELAKAMAYRSSVGVRLSSVLTDLADRADEPIEQPADVTMGRHFAVPASSRRRHVLLRDVLGTLRRGGHLPPWRVDPDGVMRFGDRDPTETNARAVELSRDAERGRRRLGVDEAGPFLPGAIYEGAAIRRLEVIERRSKTEALIWQ